MRAESGKSSCIHCDPRVLRLNGGFTVIYKVLNNLMRNAYICRVTSPEIASPVRRSQLGWERFFFIPNLFLSSMFVVTFGNNISRDIYSRGASYRWIVPRNTSDNIGKGFGYLGVTGGNGCFFLSQTWAGLSVSGKLL